MKPRQSRQVRKEATVTGRFVRSELPVSGFNCLRFLFLLLELLPPFPNWFLPRNDIPPAHSPAFFVRRASRLPDAYLMQAAAMNAAQGAAMHIEDIYQAGEPAAEALVSKNALREFDRRCPVMTFVPQVPSPRSCALRGLIFAVPVSLSLWVILGLVVWAIVR